MLEMYGMDCPLSVIFSDGAKGQLISKGNFGVFNSSKKRTLQQVNLFVMMLWILNSAKVLCFLFEKEMQKKSFSNSKSLKSYTSGRNFELGKDF